MNICNNTKNLLKRLSASSFNEKFSYLFFLNKNGRYVSDIFLTQNTIFGKEDSLNRLKNHLKFFDLRNEIQFEETDKKVFYIDKEGTLNDPRLKNYSFLITDEQFLAENVNEYQKIMIENEIADNFKENLSIILNYGKIGAFISNNQCYLGQELISAFKSSKEGVKKGVKYVNNLDNEEFVEIVSSCKIKEENYFLILKKLI